VTAVRAGGIRGQQLGWRTEPCAARFGAGLVVHDEHGTVEQIVTCQRPQKFQGPKPATHYGHRWTGEIDGNRVEITWWEP
jgi:hypothetical protein